MTDTSYNYFDTGKGIIKAWTKGVDVDAVTMTQASNIASMPFIHKHVALMPDMSVGPVAFDINATVTSVRYKFVQGLRWRDENRFEEDSLNFWIPSDENWNPLECVRQMAEDYSNYHDLRNS